MRLEGTTCAVPHAANDNDVSDDAIAQHVGWNGDDLTASLRTHAAAFGMVRQTGAGGEQPLAQALSSDRARLARDMGDYGLDIGHRAVGPDYFRHEYGVGSWSGVPNDSSHSRTRSCGKVLPAWKSASASASAAKIASSSSSKMSGSGSAMPYDTRNSPRTNREKPSFWSAS